MNVLTIRPDRLERLRTICLQFPEATEQVAWGDPTWRVRGKIFAMQKGNYQGGRPSVWMKAAPDAQQVLVGAHPHRFFVPPYVGSKGWVAAYLDGRVGWTMIEELVRQSYCLIAPKRLAQQVQS